MVCLLALGLGAPAGAKSRAKAPPPPPPPAPPAYAGATLRCVSPKLVEGQKEVTVASVPKPERGVEFQDPNFHACVVRATDHRVDGLPGFARHDYSRRQSFNADSTLFFANSHDGGWYLYDANTLQMLHGLKGLGGDCEPQWDPKSPTTLYYGDRNGGLFITALDVVTGKSKIAIDLRGKLPWPTAARAWTKSEGSPSRDGQRWPFMVQTNDFKMLGLAVWDMAAGKLVGTVSMDEGPDHVSMSPSGRWIVVSGDGATVAWKADFSWHYTLRKGGEHSDLAVGANGHDMYVSVDFASNDGDVIMIDIETGQRTALFPTYHHGGVTSVHISGKAFDRPGWVLVSTYDPRGPKPWWYIDQLFALELRANPRIYQIASHHSDVGNSYFAEPQATTNRDFTKILFNSNWGPRGTEDIDAYLVRLPPNAFP
jgi:hypothetical protein